jgi:hypothetical protein
MVLFLFFIVNLFWVLSFDILHLLTDTPWLEGHRQTMRIDNPPSPPFRKGGMGGFESYFLINIGHSLDGLKENYRSLMQTGL